MEFWIQNFTRKELSSEITRLTRSRRKQQKWVHIAKQTKIAQKYSYSTTNKRIIEPHRNHKTHSLNCGNPRCVFCSNPRKMFGEKTIQELSFYQKQLIEYEYE